MNSFPAGFYAEYLYGIEKRFVSFAKKINSLIFSAIHTELEWRNDSSLFDLIEQIRNNLGEYSNSEEMENFIRKKYGLIDKWSVEKTNEILSDKPFYPKPNPDDPLDYAVPKPQVPAFNLKDKEALEKIPLASRNARLAQNALYREHFEEVEDIINDGIIQGKKAEDITKDILAKVDMNSKRARFWAEDQLANFRTENQILRARKAGFNWYRWKISGIRTRDTHKDNNRKIFSLKVGAKNLSKPGARHPGQDYRCHCEMEFLTDEEVARLGLTLPDSNPPKSSEEVAQSYGLFQNAVEWVKNQFGKLTKSKEVPKFETVSEAESWAIENNIGDIINYKGLDIEIANSINQSIYEAIKEFPELRKNFKFIGSAQERGILKYNDALEWYLEYYKKIYPNLKEDELFEYARKSAKREKIGKDVYALAYRGDRSGVTWNKNWSYKKATKQLSKDVEAKFHPVGTNNIKAVIDHEVGHKLDDLLEITNDLKIRELMKELIDFSQKDNENKYKKITEGLSKYSWKNGNSIKLREMTAEAYAEFKNNPKVRMIAKKIGDRIKEKYKELYGK